jgi:hypothetical protein
MSNSQNLASLRFSIFTSSSKGGRLQNQTKSQDPVTTTASAITQSPYTASILMDVDRQRTGRRISEGLHRKETREASTRDPPNTIREAEPQTMAEGTDEAHTL